MNKKDMVKVIVSSIPDDADETELTWWMCSIPTAKRSLLLKKKIYNRQINNAETELEILKGEIGLGISRSGQYTATERNKIIEYSFVTSERYKELHDSLNEAYEKLDEINADIECLNDKSFMVRKIADFLRIHLSYEEGE